VFGLRLDTDEIWNTTESLESCVLVVFRQPRVCQVVCRGEVVCWMCFRSFWTLVVIKKKDCSKSRACGCVGCKWVM
jgi:hypothetical protein